MQQTSGAKCPLNANVNIDRNNKGLVRICHVLGAMLNLYRMKKYRCYRKDSMTEWLCAHEHMGSGTTLPRCLLLSAR